MGVHGGARTGYWWTIGSRHGDSRGVLNPITPDSRVLPIFRGHGDSKPGDIGRGRTLTKCGLEVRMGHLGGQELREHEPLWESNISCDESVIQRGIECCHGRRLWA